MTLTVISIIGYLGIFAGLAGPIQLVDMAQISIALVVSLSPLITPMSTSIMAAAMEKIRDDLLISSYTTQITFSIYILRLTFDLFLISALSEIYGRRPV